MRIIGLTGGIASGKSTVAKILEEWGAAVIDADQLSREVVVPGGRCHEAIVAEFGTEILNPDLTINRAALGAIVFADAQARKRLEGITHPAIGRCAEEKLASLRAAGAEIVIYMAPLLIEAGISSRVDEVWVVYADPETQIARIIARDGADRAEALRRIAAQMPMTEKVKYGKVVIDNRGSLVDTVKQVRELWESELSQYRRKNEEKEA
jgi:dephospho-CoA kinase